MIVCLESLHVGADRTIITLPPARIGMCFMESVEKRLVQRR